MKKETTLSVLKEIRDLLKIATVPQTMAYSAPKLEDGWIEIDFPAITAKEIIDQCNNKTSKGKPLIWSSWHTNEPFYTTEKCREGKKRVNLSIRHKDKTWNECKELLKEAGEEMLSFPELLYTLYFIEKSTEKVPQDFISNYSWTSSKSNEFPGRVASLGGLGEDGADVYGWDPGSRDSDLGVSSLRSLET